MPKFSLVVEGPTNAVREFMHKAVAVQLKPGDIRRREAERRGPREQPNFSLRSTESDGDFWLTRPPLSFRSLSASLPYQRWGDPPDANNTHLESVQESLNGLMRVRYVGHLGRDSDGVDALTPFLRSVSNLWSECRFLVVTSQPYQSELISGGRVQERTPPNDATEPANEGKPGDLFQEPKIDDYEAHEDGQLPSEWTTTGLLSTPTIEWVEVQTEGELAAGHGLSIWHALVRHGGPVAFIQGYPFVQETWLRIPVRILMKPPSSQREIDWGLVVQETRAEVEAMFKPDAAGRIRLRFMDRQAKVALCING